jgi:hypothetical protein
VSIAANFSFMNDEPITLSFFIEPEDGSPVRTIFENKTYESGAHLIKFGFSDFYEEGTNFVAKLVDQNGDVFKSVTVNEHSPYEEKDIHQIRYNYTFTIRAPLEHMRVLLKNSEGDYLMKLKDYPKLGVAYHNLAVQFYHYEKPDSKFILEVVDAEGKVYDRTEFDAYRRTKKLYQEWK